MKLSELIAELKNCGVTQSTELSVDIFKYNSGKLEVIHVSIAPEKQQKSKLSLH